MRRQTLARAMVVAIVAALLLWGVAEAAVTFTVIPIDAQALGEAKNPETDGAWVVWDSKAVLPGANWNIVARNLRATTAVVVATGNDTIDDKDQMLADVSLGRVVYEQHTAVGNSDIRMHDLVSGVNTVIAENPAKDEGGPRISGDLVIWKNKTDDLVCYKNVRTGAAGALSPALETIAAWDVDRGRIVYISSDGLHGAVQVFRPGIDSAHFSRSFCGARGARPRARPVLPVSRCRAACCRR